MPNYGLEVFYATKAKPYTNLVFIHGFGSAPSSAPWHHDETGKLWISDPEFIVQFKRPFRALAFHYNGDVAANMTAASLAFQAWDLLGCLESAMEADAGPIFFVCHGLGGLIAKKALRLCHALADHPKLKRCISGIIFFGTPHVYNDKGALLEAVRNTHKAFGSKGSVASEEDMREFTQVAAQLNQWFAETMPKDIKTLSIWEGKDVSLKSSIEGEEGEQAEELRIIPESSSLKGFFSFNKDIEAPDHNHMDLAKFSTPYEKRFIEFVEQFTVLVNSSLQLRSQLPPLPASLRPKSPPTVIIVPGPSPGPGPRPLPSPRPPSPPPINIHRRRRRDDRPRRKRRKDDDHASGNKKGKERKGRETSEQKKARNKFLSSLHGWTPFNTGSEIMVAPGTCEWFKNSPFYQAWVQDPGCCTFFFLGLGAQGKTYLAKAISDELRSMFEKDRVISFFCDPQDPEPAVWEYFTWRMITDDSSWFEKVPMRFRDRDKDSPRLGNADFVEIWTAFRTSPARSNIHLVIDGLEQCGDDVFNKIFACVQQLRRIPVDLSFPTAAPYEDDQITTQPLLKVLYTCRLTDSVLAASSIASRATMEPALTKTDVARFVDDRINRCAEMETLRQGDTLEKLKQQIKEEAGAYWPYAKFAIEEIEASDPIRQSSGPDQNHRSYKGHVPAGMADWLRAQVLPVLQSVENNNWRKTVLLLLLSDRDDTGPFMLAQLEDIVKCLHGIGGEDGSEGEATQKMRLADDIGKHLGNLVYVKERGPVWLTDGSVRHFLNRYLTEEERDTNMAFASLSYMLRDDFISPLPLSRDDPTGSGDWLDRNYPFYRVAANVWLRALSKLNHVDDRLRPLLLQFLRPGSPQLRTWNLWRAWGMPTVYAGEEVWGRNQVPAIMTLLTTGAVGVIKDLYDVDAPYEERWWKKALGGARTVTNSLLTTTTTTTTTTAIITGTEEREYLSLPEDWPNTMGYLERPALQAAAFTDYNTVEAFDWVLSFNPDVNQKGGNGRSLLRILFGWKYGPQQTDTVETKIYIARELLRRGADPMSTDSRGITALHVAANEGELAYLHLLLDHGARVNATEIDGKSPLEVAYVRASMPVLQEMIAEGGADPQLWWAGGRSALSQAFLDSDADMFDLFLRMVDPNQRDLYGQAAIHFVCAGHRLHPAQFLEKLLAHPFIDVDVSTRQLRQHPAHDPEGWTALLYAVQQNDLELSRMLLEAGASPDTQAENMASPIMEAVIQESQDMVELLLSYQAPVNRYHYRLHPNRTALAEAVARQNEKLVALLLQHGADPTVEEGFGTESCLYIATDHPEPKSEIMRLLLVESRIPPDVNYLYNDDESRPLIVMAAERADAEMVRLLLAHGADTSRWTRKRQEGEGVEGGEEEGEEVVKGEEDEAVGGGGADEEQEKKEKKKKVEKSPSPLHAAVLRNNKEMCEMLLAHDPALLDVASEAGEIRTPLQLAVSEDHFPLAKYLLEKGASASATTLWYEETALIMAASRGLDHGRKRGKGQDRGARSDEWVKLLLDACPSVLNAQSHVGTTALMMAVEKGDLRSAEMLLQAGADKFKLDIYGNSCFTPELFRLPSGGAIPMLRLLQKHGADFNDPCYSGEGMTVLGIAAARGSPEVVKWLIKEGGADPLKAQRFLVKDGSWATAVQVATCSFQLEVVSLLLQPEFGMREHLAHEDWLGGTVLPTLAPSKKSTSLCSIIFSVCEEMQRETGRDVFSELIHQPTISGYSPWDYVIHLKDGRRSQEVKIKEGPTREEFDRTVGSYLACYLETRNRFVLNEAIYLLVIRGGFETDVPVLAVPAESVPAIDWKDGVRTAVTMALWLCHACSGEVMAKVWVCHECWSFFCESCQSQRKSKWEDMCTHDKLIEITLDLKVKGDEDWFLERVKGTMDRLLGTSRVEVVEDVSHEEEDVGLSGTEFQEDVTKEQQLQQQLQQEKKLQSSLQLATLHAFGYLAIRKSLFTPYLPLAPQTESIIAPWQPLIQDMTSIRERWLLGYEMSGYRRFEELRYLKRGLRRSLSDVEGYLSDLTLAGLENLLMEKEEEKKEGVRESGWWKQDGMLMSGSRDGRDGDDHSSVHEVIVREGVEIRRQKRPGVEVRII